MMIQKFRKGKLGQYLSYLLIKPGFEKNHFFRILIESTIVIIFLVYYLINFETTKWYYLLFIAFYLYEVLHFYKKIRKKYLDRTIYVDHNFGKQLKIFQGLTLSERQKMEGWEIRKFFRKRKNSLAVYSKDVNNFIQNKFSSIKIKLNPKKHQTVLKYIVNNWSTHYKFLQYKALQSFAKNKDFFNDKKVCLGSDMALDVNSLDIYYGTYFDSILTNEACGSIHEDIVTGEKSKLLSINSFTKNGKILELSASLCNNHIGVSTLAITKDKKLLFWTQNSRTMQNSNQLIPTGSGSLDMEDVKSVQESLEDIIITGTNRELIEECNIGYNNIIDTKVIGFWRWVERGGKPEFSSVSLLNLDSSQLNPDISEIKRVRESHYSIDIDNPKFKKEITKFIKDEKSSMPLLMSLTIFLEYCESENYQEFIKRL